MTLPPNAPQPSNPQEKKAEEQILRSKRILLQWMEADPERVQALQERGVLFREMLAAYQQFLRARRWMRNRGTDWDAANEIAEHDCLFWESKEEIEAKQAEIAQAAPE